MVRAHFAVLAVAAGLGLLSGCSSLSRLSPFHRHLDSCPCEGSMYDGDGSVSTDGPNLGDFAAAPIAPPPVAPPGAVSTVPPGQVPPLGPPPRLFAQPQTAPATPNP
jgi:hypothetical protein